MSSILHKNSLVSICIYAIIAICLIFVVQTYASAQDYPSPIGYWKCNSKWGGGDIVTSEQSYLLNIKDSNQAVIYINANKKNYTILGTWEINENGLILIFKKNKYYAHLNANNLNGIVEFESSTTGKWTSSRISKEEYGSLLLSILTNNIVQLK